MLAALLLLTAVAPAPTQSAPINNIRYDVSFTRETAANRSLHVRMQFDVNGTGDVILSLPAWTPGAYEMTWFAKWVSGFSPTAAGKPLRWDKVDFDTWRIRPAGARALAVDFDFQADSLDNAMAWSHGDFAFFNGTNVFLYPEGRSLDFPATVTFHTEADWQVATGMHRMGAARGEKRFHDLVDMPVFIGHFELDSADVDGLNVRLATYPVGQLSGEARQHFWADYRRMFAPEVAVFGERPYDDYTTMIVFDSSFGGGSALEHQSSHLSIFTPLGIGQEWQASITAHEMFHAFNVKRMRPAEMVPYRYDAPQPTPWLWVSEGITDYYADLALLRGGIVDSTGFFDATQGKIAEVSQTVPVALEDASLSTWIHPTDGTGYLYYPKGSLAGFMLDILIRDASDNRRSLDDVMRQVYTETYKKGLGFGEKEWWGAVRKAAGRDFPGFNDRYIDGREPFPWDSILPLAGLSLTRDTTWLPRLGIQSNTDSAGITHVTSVTPGGAADAAGVQNGDLLLALGDITVTGEESFQKFRETYSTRGGAALPIRIRRGEREQILPGTVRLAANENVHLVADAAASAKAARVRSGLLHGTTTR